MKRYLQFLSKPLIMKTGKGVMNIICSLLIVKFSLFTAFAQTPVAQYTFTGNASDVTTFGNNAVVAGATLTQDRFGYANSAFYFDGTQSTVIAPNATQLNSAATTISFWVKVKALPATGEAFLLSHGGWQERWKISLPSHGRPVFTTNSTSGIKDMDTDSASLPVGTWTHVVMVHDTVNNKIFFNGVLKKSSPSAGALNKTTKPFGMGFSPLDACCYFNGSLDEVTIYNSALTDAQIATLYTTQNTAPAVANARVAAYSFNGSAFDSSAYNNHGTLINVKPTTDRFGFGARAYAFNGINSGIRAANSAVLNSAATTVSFWVKVNALPSNGEAYLLSYGGWQERWKISLPGHGKVVWSTNNVGTGNSDMDAGDGNALPIGTWKHVVMVHDGTNDKIYIDGAKKASKAVTGNLKNTQYPLGIGYSPIDTCCFFNGAIDEVQIYNYALADADITALFAAQSASTATVTDLVASYKLNGNGKDFTQFGNDATGGNATPTANRFSLGGNAMNFNGKDSLVASNSIALQSDNTTIAFWVKVNALPGNGEVYLLSNGGWQERWKISLPAHGKPVWSTNNVGTGNSDMDSGDGNALPVGVWKHLTMIHDGTNDKIYIDGVKKNSKAVIGALKKTVQPFGIAYNPIESGAYFNGSLSDILVYNRALSDAEVTALFGTQNTAQSLTDSIVANYPFNGSGIDISNYGNTATLQNVTLTKDRFGKSNKAIAVSNSFATAANSPQLNSPLTTVSFWVKVNALPANGEAYLLSFGGWQERWKISLPGHGKPVWSTNNIGTGNSDMDSGDGNALPVGVWKQVVMVHDGIADKIYIDGVKKASKAVTGNLKTTKYPLGFGWSPIDSCCAFNGSLDDVQIYSVALNDLQIAALFAAQSVAPVSTDLTAPTVPLNLSATVSFTNVTLAWLPSTDNVGVTGYNVYQNDSLILTTTNTSSLLVGLKANTKYKFGVSAVDAAGNESSTSTIQATTGQDQTPDIIPPTVPGNLTAQAGSNSVQLTWKASTDNRGVVGYVVLQDGVVIDTVTTLSKLVSGLKVTTAYTFNVYAFDAAKNKSAQAEVTVTTLKAIDTGEPGLVAYYPFDGNANDATPYANHGVIGGKPTFVAHSGVAGQAIKFNGGDTVLCKNAVQLISDYTTLGFWIRVDSTNLNDAEAYVIDFGHWDQRMKISLPQHRKIVFTTNSKNTQFPNAISDMDSGDGNDLTKGIWWYVTMVHDGTSDIIYVNGVQTNIKPAPGKLNNTARALAFGGNPIDGGQYFLGALDNLKIYNKALTAAEVKKLFTTGTTPVEDVASAELLAFVKSIFPNPTTDILTIKHAFTGTDAVLVRVFDIAGREIDAINFAKNKIPAEQFSINVANYPKGTYLLNFVQEGKSLGALKFVKE